MSKLISTKKIQVRNPNTGVFESINMVASNSYNEILTDLQDDIKETTDKAEAALEKAQTAANNIESQKDTMIASIASVAGQGTDTTLTQSGVAADAKVTGDEISELKDDLADIVFCPTMRNGSVVNANNQNAIACETVLKNTGEKFVVSIDDDVDEGWFRIQLSSFTVSAGTTLDSRTNRICCDCNYDVKSNTFVIDSNAFGDALGWAFALYKYDSSGTAIPLRISDEKKVAVKVVSDEYSDNVIYSLSELREIPVQESNFCHAVLSGTTGEVLKNHSSMLSRIVSDKIICADRDMTLSADGCEMYICFYSASGTFLNNSGWVTSYAISEGTNYRLQITSSHDIINVYTPIQTLANSVTYQSKIAELLDYKSPIKLMPVLRDGSVMNVANTHAIANKTIIPINSADTVRIRYTGTIESTQILRIQTTIYSVSDGDTGSTTSSYRIFCDKNIDVATDHVVLRKNMIGGTAQGIGVAFYIINSDGSYTDLRIDDVGDCMEVTYNSDAETDDAYIINSALFRECATVTFLGTLTYAQSFCKYNGKYYSTDGSNIGSQNSDFSAVSSYAVSVGHGNAFQIGNSSYAYISGWDDNIIYKVNLDTVSVDSTITLPTTGYTTGCVDEDRNVAYVFQRDTLPSTEECYNFIVYDLDTNTIQNTKKTVPFAAMQACDYYRDRILVAYGTHSDSAPNGIMVMSVDGRILADINVDESIYAELEGVCFDRESGNIIFSDVERHAYELKLTK